jgi:hypothetical protein
MSKNDNNTDAATGPLPYQDAIITIIDLLGFRDLVAASVNAEQVFNYLKAFQVTANVGSLDSIFPWIPSTKHFFADTVLRITPIPSDDVNIVGDLAVRALLEVRDIQIKLVMNSVLVRGAVVRGLVYECKRGVFGPGFIAAIDLEKKTKFPRIAVDRSVIHAFELSRVQHKIPYIVQEESSESYFVDYLNSARWEFFNLEAYLQFLLKHGHALDPLINKKFRSSSSGVREALMGCEISQ